MTKIHGKVFAQSALDRERDEALGQRMAALSFVRPEHLDIPAVYQDEKVTTSCARMRSVRSQLRTLLGDSLFLTSADSCGSSIACCCLSSLVYDLIACGGWRAGLAHGHEGAAQDQQLQGGE